MESYSDFAYLYDTFMEDVPYEMWAEIITELIERYSASYTRKCAGNLGAGKSASAGSKNILDLGCGTGTLTSLMAKKGYIMTGADYSVDMLSVARNKAIQSGDDILYICQDMRELELPQPADAVICVCDSINYMTSDEDMDAVMNGVYANLKKDGLFVLDFNTLYKYETVIGDTTIAENREDCSFIWENYFDPETHINEYDVTFFAKVCAEGCTDGQGDAEGCDDGQGDVGAEDEELFRRFTETHVQKGYTLSEMRTFAKKAGFSIVAEYEASDSDEDSDGEFISFEDLKSPDEESERIYLVLKK